MQHGGVVQPGGLIQYAIPVAVFLVIFAFRARRMSRARPLKLWQLWIVPGILALATAVTFATMPPSGTGWLIAGAALLVGTGLGWQRGRMMHIEVDRATGTLMQRASPVAILFLLGLFVVRSAMRYEGRALGMDVATLTDALLALALGMFGVMRVEMFLRARRLLGEHRDRAAFS